MVPSQRGRELSGKALGLAELALEVLGFNKVLAVDRRSGRRSALFTNLVPLVNTDSMKSKDPPVRTWVVTLTSGATFELKAMYAILNAPNLFFYIALPIADKANIAAFFPLITVAGAVRKDLVPSKAARKNT
jgi:hypothetical protein